MSTRRFVMATGLVMCLSACQPLCQESCQEATRLCEAQNKALKQQLNDQTQQYQEWAKRINSHYAYWERQAAIAKGCDVLFPVCTTAMTEQGRDAVRRGFGGLDDEVLWLIAMAKLMLIAGIVAIALWYWGWVRGRIRVSQQRILDEIQAKQEALELQEREIDRRFTNLERETANERVLVAELEGQIVTSQKHLDGLRGQYNEMYEAYQLLDQRLKERQAQECLLNSALGALKK